MKKLILFLFLVASVALGQSAKPTNFNYGISIDSAVAKGASLLIEKGGVPWLLLTPDSVKFFGSGPGTYRLFNDGTSMNIIGGDKNNSIGAGSTRSIIAAGGGTGFLNTIGNGSYLTVIGGGYDNQIGDTAFTNTISGGAHHRIYFTATHGTIGGGSTNTLDTASDYGTIAGGLSNRVSADYGAIGGGSNNTASGFRSSIIGGSSNVASGQYSATLGGQLNNAVGDYSIAAGRRATANGAGSFVFADGQNANYIVNTVNAFAARFAGGYQLTGGNVDVSAEVYLPNTHFFGGYRTDAVAVGMLGMASDDYTSLRSSGGLLGVKIISSTGAALVTVLNTGYTGIGLSTGIDSLLTVNNGGWFKGGLLVSGNGLFSGLLKTTDSLAVTKGASVGGNLEVNGTGTSKFAGTIQMPNNISYAGTRTDNIVVGMLYVGTDDYTSLGGSGSALGVKIKSSAGADLVTILNGGATTFVSTVDATGFKTSGTTGYLFGTSGKSATDFATPAEALQWDGGSTNLVAATGRTSLGLGTAAQSAASDFWGVGTAAGQISALGAKTAFSPAKYIYNSDRTDSTEVFTRTQTVNGTTVHLLVTD